jgi:ribosome-binding factor A
MARADRVAELIKQEVSDIISRKLHDPRIGFASVTAVDIGPDLHNASIHVSVYGTEKEQNDTMAALRTATRFVRRELGSRLQLRDVPEILFRQDTSIERGAKVFAIINKLHKEEEQKAPESNKAKKSKAVKKNA